MERFKNILVGVDLSEPDRLVSDKPTAPSEEAIHRAIWLAKANSASVRFVYALDSSTLQPSGDAHQIAETSQGPKTVKDHAKQMLTKIVQDAKQQGIVAESEVVVGKSWVELIRQALRNKHDLVIAGTRRFGAFRSIIFGSTGIKLLRKCPCPVWITLPRPDHIASILVAHDLKAVGDMAMELGCSMAQRHNSQLHIFHAILFPEMDDMFPSRVSAKDVARYRTDAEQHFNRQLAGFQLSSAARVHLECGLPYSLILNYIERHNIELLVMGTVARTGIAGLITGNTAELLLPHVPCSILAVKPKGFQSPVTLG